MRRRPWPASAGRRRGVRADRRGAAARAPARRAVRRSLRLLLAAARLPGLPRRSSSRTGATRSIPATVVGKPRQEDFFIGDLLQELLSPLFPLVMPAVERLWSYGETGYHSLAGAVVKQRYAREAMASAFRILGEGQLSLTKFLLRHRPATSTCRTSAPRSSTCSRARIRRRTSTSSRTSRWTRSTTRVPRSTRARRACGSASAIRCASCRASSARRRRCRAA